MALHNGDQWLACRFSRNRRRSNGTFAYLRENIGYHYATETLSLMNKNSISSVRITTQTFMRQLAVRRQNMVTTVVAVVVVAWLWSSTARAGPSGWRLTWSDEFNAIDEDKWHNTKNDEPANDDKQTYLPGQVSVSAGKLVILSENEPAGELPFRSGQVVSTFAQRLGRWEVRAQIPTTSGFRPAIRLLPRASDPSRYAIDIMVSRGDRPTITSSGCHWDDDTPTSEDRLVVEQRCTQSGELISFPEAFHTYAVEWDADQLRFYVDDVHHATLYPDEVGDFLSRPMSPMQLVIDAAIGGEFSPMPDASTKWPQRFLIDSVRVYEPSNEAALRSFSNGDFEASGGTLAGWHVFGNVIKGDPNVLVNREEVNEGKASLKLSGQSTGGANYSGVSQGISVSAGERIRTELTALVRSSNSLAKTSNRALMKIEFYNRFGDYFGGPAMLGVHERAIADGSTPCDAWSEHELVAVAPAGAVEARLSIVFEQPINEPGAVYVDTVEFEQIKE